MLLFFTIDKMQFWYLSGCSDPEVPIRVPFLRVTGIQREKLKT